MDKKLRVGIIGCGGIANGKHMPSLKAIGRVDMVAFCDIIVEKAEKVQLQVQEFIMLIWIKRNLLMKGLH